MQQKLLPLEDVLSVLMQRAEPITDQQSVPLKKASGRILARELVAPHNVPAFDNSRMDGYAVRAAQCTSPLPISQIITAGDKAQALKDRTAARIFTGAPLPAGADSVEMQENTKSDGKIVQFLQPVRPDQNIGRAGEDITKGASVLTPGHRLLPQDLGLAASMGYNKLDVYRRPRVAIFSTGDELKEPGEPLQEGQIYNSNRYILGAMIERTGCELVDLGIVADDLEETGATLRKAAQSADVVITSGGVSVGEKDYLREALEQSGKLDLWRIRIKPGKPLVFGHIDVSSQQTPYLGLPGNPVSVFVTYLMLAQPFLLKCSGASVTMAKNFKVKAGFKRARPQTRRQFLRCKLKDQDGERVAVPYANQSSGVLTSTSHSDGLAGCFSRKQNHRRRGPDRFLPLSGIIWLSPVHCAKDKTGLYRQRNQIADEQIFRM